MNVIDWSIWLIDWFDLIGFHSISLIDRFIWFDSIELIWSDMISLAKVVDFEPLGAFFALGGLEADLTPIRRSHRIHVHYENIVIPC